jgi:DNA-binding CsgD family transcriptional regulator
MNKEDLKFTPRELDIIKLIANDMSTRNIADKLFVSVRTIDAHRYNMVTKFRTNSIVGVVAWAFRNGIVE